MSSIVGRLVLGSGIVSGAVIVEGALITDIDTSAAGPLSEDAPYVTPGLVDIHVHGWGGHDAMGSPSALDGMARALLRRGVTSFLPTAVSAPFDELAEFAERVRTWIPSAPADGAEPLGFNLEGPFLSAERRGAHDPAALATPDALAAGALAPLLDQLRVITIAPELPGALELIAMLAAHDVVVSLGHSAATYEQATAGYAAGARSTTHLFNAMSGIDHRSPGLAAAALLADDAAAELIADGIHVSSALWPLVARMKGRDRLVLVTDAMALAGTGDGDGRIGSLAVQVRNGRVTLAGTDTLAGSVLSLDVAVANMVEAGIDLPLAVGAASRNPLELLGISDRGRLAAGQRADLVELNPNLTVRRVMRAGEWLAQ